MSLHRTCCCVSGECGNVWGGCPATLYLDVLSMNMQRQGVACDSGAMSGCSWSGLTITDDLNASITNLEFEYVPAAGSVQAYYRLKDLASNSGIVTVSLSMAGDNHPYVSTLFGACSATWTPAGAGSFTNAFNALDPDQTAQGTGSIRSGLYWNGTAFECRFILQLDLEIIYYDRYDYNFLRWEGGYASVQNASAPMVFRVLMTATAPYAPATCPHTQMWTIQAMSYSLSLTLEDSAAFASGLPEPSRFTDCPVGTSVDCGAQTPASCFYALGYDSVVAPYLSTSTVSWEPSGFVLWTNDNPGMDLTS